MKSIKKVLALVFILSFVISTPAYCYEEDIVSNDFSGEFYSTDVDFSMEETEVDEPNRFNQSSFENAQFSPDHTQDLIVDGETVQSTVSFSNGIVNVECTELIMPENSSRQIAYTILDPSYEVDFWYEGNHNYVINVTDDYVIINSHEPEINMMMVHYINHATGNEGHFIINITVYPQRGYIYT